MLLTPIAADAKSPASEAHGDELSRAEYQQIRSQLSRSTSPLPTLAIVAFDVALLYAAVLLLRRSTTPAFVVSQVLLATVFFNAFAVLHECGHGLVSKRRWVNIALGHLASAFCFIPFYPWKYIHQQHHTWTGNPRHDPVTKSLRKWRGSRVPWIVRIAWWSWIPLGALLQHVIYLTYPLTMWRGGQMTRGKALRTLASIGCLPLPYLALAALAPQLLVPANLWLSLLLFLMSEELVNIPHHTDMSSFDTKLPVWQQYRATRSCYYPAGLSELLVLNFNFHTEHHLFPDLPWYRLRQARRRLKPALATRYREAIGIAWNVENRRRDLQAIVDGDRNAPAARRSTAGDAA